jgi:hypothetical protein
VIGRRLLLGICKQIDFLEDLGINFLSHGVENLEGLPSFA